VQVTRVAHRFFGVSRNTTINTINEDARWFAMRAAGKYDAIFIDAFNDLSVPYHLTTRELTVELRRLLRPGGALAANVIDSVEHGRFLASYTATLESAFGRGNVAVLMESEEDIHNERSTFVVVASPQIRSILASTAAPALPTTRLPPGIVLTDDHAPVDNMLAPLFTARFVDEAGE
jgi:spermidine synthase